MIVSSTGPRGMQKRLRLFQPSRRIKTYVSSKRSSKTPVAKTMPLRIGRTAGFDAVRGPLTINRKDLATGAIFIAFGAVYGSIALRTLPIGGALEMGPGYFPIILSGLMIAIGAAVAVRSFFLAAQSPFGKVPWRSVVMLSLSTLFFATFLRKLGMLPCVFFTSLIACGASSQIEPKKALLGSACIAVLCTLVFIYGIKLPLPMIGPWFGRWW
jgi:hypothetical protein